MTFHLVRRSRDFCVRYSIVLVGCGPPLLLIGLFVGWVGFTTVRERLHRLPFDSVKWQERQDTAATDPVRVRMVDDLVSRFLVVGMTREQVVALLGEPIKSQYTSESELYYWLGRDRGMGLDNEWLVVTLDADACVISTRVERD